MEKYELSTPDELNSMLKDDIYIKDFWNRVTFDRMSKPKAWATTFRVDYPLTDSHTTKMYRWLKKPLVEDIGSKADRALSVDLMDNKLDILDRMYKIAMDKLEDEKGEKIPVSVKIQAETGKYWLESVKQDKSINLNIQGGSQVNIVQVLDEKLASLTQGATISPDGAVEMIEHNKGGQFAKTSDKSIKAIDAILVKDK